MINKTSPLQVATNLQKYAKETIEAAEKLRNKNNTTELNTLLDDMTAMAHLGWYYAQKIEAATELAFYSQNKKSSHKDKAVLLLEEAVLSWDAYRKISEKNYKPQRLARTRVLNWTELMEFVKKDVSLAKNFRFFDNFCKT